MNFCLSPFEYGSPAYFGGLPHTSAAVCLSSTPILYPVLRGFDGFRAGGNLPMQGGVLPLQSLYLVASEKRTDTLGHVGCCGRGCSFRFLGLHLFSGLAEPFRAASFGFCKSAISAFRLSAGFWCPDNTAVRTYAVPCNPLCRAAIRASPSQWRMCLDRTSIPTVSSYRRHTILSYRSVFC